MPSKAAAQAALILEKARKYGYSIEVSGGVLTIHKTFDPSDGMAFIECDASYHSVLECLPRTRPGSDWGTDGGGIGGMIASETGSFTMNRSGGSKRVLRALAKML